MTEFTSSSLVDTLLFYWKMAVPCSFLEGVLFSWMCCSTDVRALVDFQLGIFKSCGKLIPSYRFMICILIITIITISFSYKPTDAVGFKQFEWNSNIGQEIKLHTMMLLKDDSNIFSLRLSFDTGSFPPLKVDDFGVLHWIETSHKLMEWEKLTLFLQLKLIKTANEWNRTQKSQISNSKSQNALGKQSSQC